ncbi:DUF4258 domain-containing protein [Flavobacterium longum]|uniref:DUF4258 domain-containing protein n=1 Tax=Flavobacterium longum TaxID=1299340 RepID=UPI0039E7CC6D
MKFTARLGYYMIGLTIGLFIVAAIWSGKDTRCNYFPNARVLANFRSKPMEFSPEVKQQLKSRTIDSMDIVNTLKTGDVDFDRSNKPVGRGKKYVVEGKTAKGIAIELEVINLDDKSILQKVTKP